MSREILPVGVTCNLRCDYCYEQVERDAEPVQRYNREAVLAGAKTAKDPWQLFGGEPLVLAFHHLEELLRIAYKQFGYTGIQTNGALITEKYIELFQKYRTQVGISIDGPGELNDARWAGTLEATRKATAQSEWAIERLASLHDRHVGPSLIVTLHGGNVSRERFPQFEAWLRRLDVMGVRFINFHFMEEDYKSDKWALDSDGLTWAMMRLNELSAELTHLKFLNFDELTRLLQGNDDKAMCVWKGCDPFSTAAVQGLNNNGEPSNCTMGSKTAWLPAEGAGSTHKWELGDFITQRHHERQLSLYVTPQEFGGCKGCRFWLMCQGYCPGSGRSEETRDWRLKTSHCQTLKALFTELERRLVEQGVTPLSLADDREAIEAVLYQSWIVGQECTMSDAVKTHRNR